MVLSRLTCEHHPAAALPALLAQDIAMRLQAAAKTEDPAATDAAARSTLSSVDSPQMAKVETEEDKTNATSESFESSDTAGAVLPSYKRTVGSQVDRYV
jgi:hypothetical protein